MLHREPSAGPTESCLDLVRNQQNAFAVTNCAQGLEQFGRDGVIAAFAQHRLENDRGDAIRLSVGEEERFQCADRIGNGDVVTLARERNAVEVRREGADVTLVGRNLAGQAKRQQRASMVARGEGDDARTAGGGTGDLDRVLDRLGTGGDQQRLLREIARRQRVQLFGQRHVGLVGHDLERGVGETVFLCLRRGNHVGVAVAGVQHGDAAREVDEPAAFNVPELRVLGTVGKDRSGGGHAARDGCLATREQGRVRGGGCLRGDGRRGFGLLSCGSGACLCRATGRFGRAAGAAFARFSCSGHGGSPCARCNQYT